MALNLWMVFVSKILLGWVWCMPAALLIILVRLSCLFLAALWSSFGKRLTSWLSCVLCFIEFRSLSLMVFWVRDGTRLHRFLIFAFLSLYTIKLRLVLVLLSAILNGCCLTYPMYHHRVKYKWAVTCDFQHCGILTSVDSHQPVQPPIKLRNSKCCTVSSLTVIEYSSDLQRLWSVCAYAQAGLSLCWSYIPHCWKSHVKAQVNLTCCEGNGPLSTYTQNQNKPLFEWWWV